MAFVPVPKTVSCAIIGELFGQSIQNVINLTFPDDPLASVVAQAAASVGEWAVGELCPILSIEYKYLRTEAQDISAEGMPAFTNVVGTGTEGGVASGSSPGGTCIAMSFRSGYGGRSYRGRNFISGIPLAEMDGNQISSTFGAALIAAYEALMPDYVFDDLPDALHTIVSRFHLGAPRVAGLASPVLTYLLTNLDVDSQRRRLTGRGT